MADKIFEGEIKAKIVDVRFALSGKTERVLKKTGDYVKKGGALDDLTKYLKTEKQAQLNASFFLF